MFAVSSCEEVCLAFLFCTSYDRCLKVAVIQIFTSGDSIAWDSFAIEIHCNVHGS